MNRIFGLAFTDTTKYSSVDNIPGTEQEKVIFLIRRLFEKASDTGSYGSGFVLNNMKNIYYSQNEKGGFLFSQTAMFKHFCIKRLILNPNNARATRSDTFLGVALNSPALITKAKNVSQPVIGRSIIGVGSCMIRKTQDIFENNMNNFVSGMGSPEEAAIKLVDHYYNEASAIKEPNVRIKRALQKTVDEIGKGSITIAFICKDNPHKLILFQTNTKLYAFYYPALGILVFNDSKHETLSLVKEIFMEHYTRERIDLTPNPNNGLIINTSANIYKKIEVNK